MVGEGRKRAEAEGLLGRCAFSVANAEALPFPDKSFDGYTITKYSGYISGDDAVQVFWVNSGVTASFASSPDMPITRTNQRASLAQPVS